MQATQVRRRVLVLSTSYPLGADASSGIFVRRLVDALRERFDMAVLCPADAATQAPSTTPGVALHAYRYAPRRWQLLAQTPGGVIPSIKAMPALLALVPFFLGSLAWSLVRLARRADLIHANWAICGALAGVLRFAHRKPIVVTLRGDDVTLAARSSLHRMLLRLAVTRASRVVCVAETMAVALRERMPEISHKIHVALNGVDSVEAAAAARPADANIELICVGSLIARKGVDVLLRAVAQLNRQDLRVRLVGEGPERGRLQVLANALGLSEQVVFQGAVAPDEVPRWLAASDIFVLPSYSEGRPNVLLEAMAAGRAIIATAIPGVIDTVRDGTHAWLFPAGDADALARALAQALAEPGERQRRAEAARREVGHRGWTWAATAEVYAGLFDRVMREVAAARDP
ncbi:glycosyltransferase [Tahibacter amnicola]|uniref:Glycosyltransferase n=1 Tax=Tahibacter amnicola TaxID=2976241 RepID=A0ABY6BCD3_9GAMM|nr:glycosyltransferase [Tahibacter amnicola]UXI67701.1 glycosyltransferase [Tahibacter amnicola]